VAGDGAGGVPDFAQKNGITPFLAGGTSRGKRVYESHPTRRTRASALDEFEAQQKEVWEFAAKRVPTWGKPEKNDYDFRSWMKGASAELLRAGCFYECGRESRKYRCWLKIQHAPRDECFWTSPPLIAFDGARSAGPDALSQSGWETWLDEFADELIANKSFAEVWQKSSAKLRKSLIALDDYSWYPKAVELPGRYINFPGSQKIELQIFWRNYNNKDIGERMKKFAALNRPPNEPGPDRRGQHKGESKVRSDLKDLSVLRIWKGEPDPWKRLKLVADVCGYKSCVAEWKQYKDRCRKGLGDEPMGKSAKSEMSRSRKRALSFFQHFFPYGKASNF
jgi:hypothetical protein